MSDIQNLKKIKTFEEEEQINMEEIKGYAFLDEAECVVNHIIEKIISLVLTETTKNKVNKLIPNYCFVEIQQILEIITYLDFLNHDKDDLKIKKHIPLERIKSAKYLNKENCEKENEELSYDKSEIIRNYKINDKSDSLNVDIFNLTKNEIIEREKEMNKEKLIMGFLKREPHQEVMTSFQKEEEKKRKMIEGNNKKKNYNFYDDRDKMINEIYSEKEPFQVNPEEKIENIKNVEIHKIEISPSHPFIHKSHNIAFDSIIDSKNYWDPLSEPKAAPIDRDAGTKIKYERPMINKKNLLVVKPKDVILEEQKNSNRKSSQKRIKFNFSSKKVNNLDKNKKKKYIQIEFESYDLEPKKYISEYDTSEMAELRKNLEKELEEKKKEKEKIAQKEKEKLEKEEKIAELRKELSKKNVTVDIKGELVFIKPIDLNVLNEEFNKGKSKFKIVKTIEPESNNLKDSKDIIIERNREIDLFDNKDDKNKKKPKKRKEELFKQKNNNGNGSKKNEQKNVFDKSNMKYASGSNFGIMNPEIGVNIMEEKRIKSGGKDFYKKFNKFSVEIFQDHLSKTTSNFYPKNKENIEENNETKKRRGSLSVRDKIKKDIDNILINTRQPTEDNNTLSLKTKNLKIALENLDLVLEDKGLDNHKKLIKKNFIKEKLNEIGVRKINYNEMNVFTKTLVGNENWGLNLYSERAKRNTFKIPTKPEKNELQRELPINILKHLPRKRLPPIINNLRGNNMGKTITSGFYTNRKPIKLKLATGDNKNSVKSVDDKAINNRVNDFVNDNEN